MDTLAYIFAIFLAVIGVVILLRCFTGHLSSIYMLIGFCCILGGITVFNKANQKDIHEKQANLLIQEELNKQRKIEYQRQIEQGEGLDFDEINAEYDQIYESSLQQQKEQALRSQYTDEELKILDNMQP